ncbi:MAG: glycyl-radical enzyme activating protein [Clostridia bacterium]|nr:glycyl-radical enzyme activating protein [Clostridia bacterium]
MTNGTVFNIQKFSVNDGPGIRTVVFLKGCMLDCVWCHNPESKSPKPQLLLYSNRCVGCGECLKACPRSLHSFGKSGEHIINRNECTSCGACADACVGALQMCGKEMTVDEVMAEVMKDEVFYKNSGGGMTVSGGEPFMQHSFAHSLLRAAKERGLNTAIETSGYTSPEILKSFVPYVDLFLWDVKESDDERHKQFTGVSNKLILKNLELLNELGAKVVLRCPLIEGYNLRPEHLAAIGALAERLECVDHVEIEPYHPLGKSKCEAMGTEYELADMEFLEKTKAEEAIAAISAVTSKIVKKA